MRPCLVAWRGPDPVFGPASPLDAASEVRSAWSERPIRTSACAIPELRLPESLGWPCGGEVIRVSPHHGPTTVEVEAAPPSVGVIVLAVRKLMVRCDVVAVPEYRAAGPSNVWSGPSGCSGSES